MDRNQLYLGDGAYVEDDGVDFELWAMRDGMRHCIFLDQHAANRFMEFVAMSRKFILIIKSMSSNHQHLQHLPDETI